MRYTALINRLLVASGEAKRTNTDVAERLRDHCVDGINIIRETLMNAVCDPRFKMHVDAIPGWRRFAQQHLEAFAERLMSISGLDEGRAYYEMNEMLDQWLTKATAIAEDFDREKTSYIGLPQDKHSKQYQYLKKALERYVYEDEDKLYEQCDEDESDDLLPQLSWDDGSEPAMASDDEEDMEETKGKNKKEGEDEGKDESNDDVSEAEDEENDTDDKPISPRQNANSSQGMGIGGGSGSKIELQNHYLSNVPPSLIKLAKLIGRSGNNVFESSGSFVSASKSDIAGITTGDDLSNLLPSELAMLSEPTTRDIFYRNFVTKRLQVFASASQGKTGKKKHDGPIIICLDTSGSMQGEPVLVAKAFTLAICIIAQRRRRKVLVVKYSYSHDLFRLHNIERDKKALLHFLGEAEMGGNDENRMFRWLFDEIMPHEGDYSSADILCISDFGWAPISEEVVEKIENEKQKGMTFYGLNIVSSEMGDFMRENMDEQDDFPGSPLNICDSIWVYENNVCKETKRNKLEGQVKGKDLKSNGFQ